MFTVNHYIFTTEKMHERLKMLEPSKRYLIDISNVLTCRNNDWYFLKFIDFVTKLMVKSDHKFHEGKTLRAIVMSHILLGNSRVHSHVKFNKIPRISSKLLLV